MTIRVALLHNIISPHVVPLFEQLARHPGISLKVYFLAVTDQNRRWDTSIGQKFQYTVLPNWAVRLGGEDLFTFFINPTVVRELRRDDFDVLISVGWDSFAALAAFALCRALRKPFILWSGSTINEPSWRRSLSLPLVKLIVRTSSAWIAYGTRARDYLIQLGAAVERVFMAYNTVDVEWYRARADELRPRREDLRRELGLGGGPVILYVGQLIERKGARDLLAAFQSISQRREDAQLVLVGYGQLEAALRAQVASAGISGVHFTGHVAIPDLPRYYVTADAFVLPSHEEVWGLVLNEAAASGLPIIATEATGAAPDLIDAGVNGYVVSPGRPDQLADALLAVLARSPEMGAASRELMLHRTYAQNVEAIVRAIGAATGRDEVGTG
jgi:glycosyltransferase involved in cell wall biosynthesis